MIITIRHLHSGAERELTVLDFDTKKNVVIARWPMGDSLEFDVTTGVGKRKAKLWKITEDDRLLVSEASRVRAEEIYQKSRMAR